MNRKERALFGLILLVFLSLRLTGIHYPILDAAASRQAANASVARNFYLHNNPFFYAELDHLGGQAVYQLYEPPLIPYFVAILYRLIGGVHEWVYRLVTLLFSLATLLLLFYFVKEIYDSKTALGTMAVYALSPIEVIMSRSLQIESALLFFSVGTLFCLHQWLRQHRLMLYMGAFFCLIMAVLFKSYSMYLFLPITYLFYAKDGLKFLRQSSFWILMASCFIIFYSYLQYQNYIIATGIPTGEFTIADAVKRNQMKFGVYLKLLISPVFLKRLYEMLTHQLLIPLALFPALIGIFTRIKTDGKFFIHSWLAAVMIYFVMMPRLVGFHGYYSLAALCPLSIFAGIGLKRIIESEIVKPKYFYRKIGFLILSLVATACTLRYTIALYTVKPEQKIVVEAGRRVDQVTERDKPIVTDGIGFSQASLIYYANRKGYRTINPTPEQMEQYIKNGAGYFVTVFPEGHFEKNQPLRDYLYKTHQLIVKEPHYLIFKLRQK